MDKKLAKRMGRCRDCGRWTQWRIIVEYRTRGLPTWAYVCEKCQKEYF